MRLRLGDLEFDVLSPYSLTTPSGIPLSFGLPLFSTQKFARIWEWDCATQRGTPDPRPPEMTVGSVLTFHRYAEDGSFDRAGTRAMMDRMRTGGGFSSLQEMGRAFEGLLPPLKVKIDYPRLADPFLKSYSLHLMGSTVSAPFLLRPVRGRLDDYGFLLVVS